MHDGVPVIETFITLGALCGIATVGAAIVRAMRAKRAQIAMLDRAIADLRARNEQSRDHFGLRNPQWLRDTPTPTPQPAAPEFRPFDDNNTGC